MTTEKIAKPLNEFSYISFDVVGTLVDFEGAIISALKEIADKAGVMLDGETALASYRNARYEPAAGLFPDDLGRCFARIAPELGLFDTAENRQALVDAAAEAAPFPDSVKALARLKAQYKLIALTNARRWAFEKYDEKLGHPFWASLTTDETGTEKPDPSFFQQAFDLVRKSGGGKDDILHAAQSQHHDIGISRRLGLTNAWIERRHDQPGYGGTIEPADFTRPDYHFHTLEEFADAAEKYRK